MKGNDNKPHIGIFGRCNSGKSSFINAITGSDVSIVSSVAGTTTDPVRKSMEIFGIGPTIIIDTAGIDDEGELGKKRVEKSVAVIKQIDCAILLFFQNSFDEYEKELLRKFRDFDIPFLIIHNKCDLEPLQQNQVEMIRSFAGIDAIDFSSVTLQNLDKVIAMLKKTIPQTAYQNPSLLGNLLAKDDIALLVTPIDSEAPDSRMILPQVMMIRDVLDNNGVSIVLKETEAEHFLLTSGIRPKIVVTDSQAFKFVDSIVPKEIMLTSFSIAFAYMRGPFDDYLKGTRKLSSLQDGDRILILESCTHQISCEDIGRSKIPKWVRAFSQRSLDFDIISGHSEISRPVTEYALVIQCGGCMMTRKQVIGRLHDFLKAKVPVTNYGMTIAYINGIFERVIEPFLGSSVSI